MHTRTLGKNLEVSAVGLGNYRKCGCNCFFKFGVCLILFHCILSA